MWPSGWIERKISWYGKAEFYLLPSTGTRWNFECEGNSICTEILDLVAELFELFHEFGFGHNDV